MWKIGSPSVAWRVLWIRVCPAFWPSICSFAKKFSWNWLSSFSRNQHGVRSSCGGFFEKNIFATKIGKWDKNSFFLSYWKNLLILIWVWSIMKVDTTFFLGGRDNKISSTWGNGGAPPPLPKNSLIPSPLGKVPPVDFPHQRSIFHASILFAHTSHANFDFNQCSIFTECCV